MAENSEKKPILITFDLEDFRRLSLRSLSLAPSESVAAVEQGVENFLQIIESAAPATRLTFFATGEFARSAPRVVRRLAEGGHEIACHGDEHELINSLTAPQFRTVLKRAKAALEDASGSAVKGFRAPSFSLSRQEQWAFEILAEEQFSYDSSLVVEKSDGMKGLRGIFSETLRTAAGELREFPLYRISYWPFPVLRALGGTYFRVLNPTKLSSVLRLVEQAGFSPHIWLHASDLYSKGAGVRFSEALGASFSAAFVWPFRECERTLGVSSVKDKLKFLLREYEPAGPLGELLQGRSQTLLKEGSGAKN